MAKIDIISGFLGAGKTTLIKKLIEDHSGKILSAITAHTDYLVAGEGGGTKRIKAEKLEVPIITEEQLMEMLS